MSALYYFFKWAIFYCSTMFAMSLDNIFWIADAPEYPKIKKNFKEITFMNRVYCYPINMAGWCYVRDNRVAEVLKHPRDILPAIITSSILAAVL